MKYLITASIIFISISIAYSQGVAINEDGSNPDASALLDVKSTSKGVLFPRMTSTQRDAIATPVIGLMIYNTNRLCLEYYSGSNWTSSTPSGTIQAFGGATVPDGWMICDGSAVSRTTYSDLFSSIIIGWGAGDAVSTFNLPDLRGRFLRGTDSGIGNDPDATSRTALYASGNTGDNVGSYQSYATHTPNSGFTGSLSATTTSAGAHTHTVDIAALAGSGGNIIATKQIPASGTMNSNSAGNHTHSVTGTISVTGGGDLETRPLNSYVNYIIKY